MIILIVDYNCTIGNTWTQISQCTSVHCFTNYSLTPILSQTLKCLKHRPKFLLYCTYVFHWTNYPRKFLRRFTWNENKWNNLICVLKFLICFYTLSTCQTPLLRSTVYCPEDDSHVYVWLFVLHPLPRRIGFIYIPMVT